MGVKAEKVHFTSQRVKVFLHTNFDRWEKYRYIQYQRSIRCYPTMFPGGAGRYCISVLKCFIGGGKGFFLLSF